MNRVINIFALVCVVALMLVACGDDNSGADGDYPVYDGDTEDQDGDTTEVEQEDSDGDLDTPVDGDDEPELELEPEIEAEPELEQQEDVEMEEEAVEAEVEETAPQNPTGAFSLLSYNIEGQQTDLTSSGHPLTNTPIIAALLNDYNVVMLQEDIYYHYKLEPICTHEYRSVPDVTDPDSVTENKGDGLNMFSSLAFSNQNDLERITWDQRSGSDPTLIWDDADVLRNKGFFVVKVTLDSGVELHLINLHLDEGDDQGDIDARAAEINQLVAYVKSHLNVPLIVTGDFEYDSSNANDVDRMSFLKNQLYLDDACAVMNCTEDLPIKVLYRSSEDLTLTPQLWSVPTNFINPENNQDLSDRKPVNVNFTWEWHMYD